ncbi:sodium/calcium exchanger family protein [Microlunatus endophyticus]|uniref:Sodium/calcium exchanger family protein n=1 Tax=Microlunatus endophyticus TaxID=1716077 RepID=A0A917W439_9ACTN|nr:sodium:proton exchanger [Microlunatus endophyticus]GGL61428.1 sodium/calcium exchanger family protein [Microlunatus endophyticus]
MLKAIRPVLLCCLVAAPAVVLRLIGADIPAPLALLAFGGAVVGASFMLAWAAEAAEHDISGGLAIAILAVIVVLPEYAVDLYFAYSAGTDPSHVAYAAANMTGSNRLLLGVGWALVVIVSLAVTKRRTGRPVRAILLESGNRIELGFLAIASLISLLIPITGQIHLVLGIALLAMFAFYLVRAAASGAGEEPELIGPAARIGDLPASRRRPLVIAIFVIAAAVILLCAEPFANALVDSGRVLGIDQFLLVQWLAPLASEAPELIVAVIFAVQGKAAGAIGMLISAKVNQWTMLVGSLPIAYLIGGGSAALPMDGRQTEEFVLTAAQTLLGIAVLLKLRFPRWLAWTLLGLFACQFVIPGTTGRLVLSGVFGVLTIGALVVNRREILPTLLAPFRRERTIIARDEQRELASTPR